MWYKPVPNLLYSQSSMPHNSQTHYYPFRSEHKRLHSQKNISNNHQILLNSYKTVGKLTQSLSTLTKWDNSSNTPKKASQTNTYNASSSWRTKPLCFQLFLSDRTWWRRYRGKTCNLTLEEATIRAQWFPHLMVTRHLITLPAGQWGRAPGVWLGDKASTEREIHGKKESGDYLPYISPSSGTAQQRGGGIYPWFHCYEFYFKHCFISDGYESLWGKCSRYVKNTGIF